MPDKVLFTSKCSTATEKLTGAFLYRWKNRDAAASKSRAAMNRNLLRYETLLKERLYCLKGVQALEGCPKTPPYSLLSLLPRQKIYIAPGNICFLTFAGFWWISRSKRGAFPCWASCCGLEGDCPLGRLKAWWHCWVPQYRHSLPGWAPCCPCTACQARGCSLPDRVAQHRGTGNNAQFAVRNKPSKQLCTGTPCRN